ncbi:hypothetical protein LXL04_023955 [Taraxacum kok-saghyz]
MVRVRMDCVVKVSAINKKVVFCTTFWYLWRFRNDIVHESRLIRNDVKPHSSGPSKFPSKKEARGRFSLAGAPFSTQGMLRRNVHQVKQASASSNDAINFHNPLSQYPSPTISNSKPPKKYLQTHSPTVFEIPKFQEDQDPVLHGLQLEKLNPLKNAPMAAELKI